MPSMPTGDEDTTVSDTEADEIDPEVWSIC